MWFKNLLPYRITELNKIDSMGFDQALQKKAFIPLGSQDRLSAGWVPPAQHAPDVMAYAHAGSFLIALKTMEKILPASVVKELADERITEIETAELRKVGKKESKEIRERIAEELLPRAFSRSRVLRALVDLEQGWIWVDTATAAKAELLIQFLRESLGSLPSKLPQTQLDPVTAMSTWLEHNAPSNFTLDADCVLKAPGDGGAQLTCRRHDLNADEIKQHLKNGKLVTQLALSWDDRIAFVLTDKLQLKRLQFLDLLQDQITEANTEDAAMLFDASLALMVLEGRHLLDAVIESLGGELGEVGSPPQVSQAAQTSPKASTPANVDVPW